MEPLEEQVAALKGKLRETDSLLQEYEKRQVGEETARTFGYFSSGVSADFPMVIILFLATTGCFFDSDTF